MSLLKQNTTKKKKVNKLSNLLKPEKKFGAENNKKYQIEIIINNMVYGKKATN